MKHIKTRLKIIVTGLASVLLFSSCVTTYDAYGRPVQTVDPGAAAVGAVLLSAAAYAVGHNNSHHYGHYGYSGGHHGGHRCY